VVQVLSHPDLPVYVNVFVEFVIPTIAELSISRVVFNAVAFWIQQAGLGSRSIARAGSCLHACCGWCLEDGEPPPELEEEGLPLPELLEDGASSPPPPPSPPQALSVNAMASIKPAAIAGA
jgi:hypothetical protein